MTTQVKDGVFHANAIKTQWRWKWNWKAEKQYEQKMSFKLPEYEELKTETQFGVSALFPFRECFRRWHFFWSVFVDVIPCRENCNFDSFSHIYIQHARLPLARFYGIICTNHCNVIWRTQNTDTHIHGERDRNICVFKFHIAIYSLWDCFSLGFFLRCVVLRWQQAPCRKQFHSICTFADCFMLWHI